MKIKRLYTLNKYPDSQGLHIIHTETCKKAPPLKDRHVFCGTAWVEEVIETALTYFPETNMWLCDQCCTDWEEDTLLLRFPSQSKNK